MPELKDLRIAILSTRDQEAVAISELVSRHLSQASEVVRQEFSTSDEFAELLADETFDLFVLSLSRKGKSASRSLASSIGTSCFKPVIAVVPTGARQLGIRAIRLGASDYLEESSVSSVSLHNTLAYAVSNHKNRLAIEHRLAFEKLVSLISTNFINLPTSQIDQGLNNALQLIGQHAQVDRSYILLMSPDRKLFNMSHEWHAEDIASAKSFYQNMSLDQFQLLFEESGEERIIFSRVEEIPERANQLKQTLQSRGVKSFLAVPMISHGQTIGFVGFASLSREQHWPKDLVSLLELVGQVFVNVLQRKETQLALFESEKRFETLIEGLGEGILYCDRNDNVIHVNSRFCELTGYTLEEVVGRSAIELFLPLETSHRLRERTLRRLQGISESYEIQFRKKNGDIFWAEISATPIRNLAGEIIGTLGAVTDITERRRALERLRRVSKNTETLFRPLRI